MKRQLDEQIGLTDNEDVPGMNRDMILGGDYQEVDSDQECHIIGGNDENDVMVHPPHRPQHDVQSKYDTLPTMASNGKPQTRNIRLNYAIMVLLFIGVFIRPYNYNHHKIQSSAEMKINIDTKAKKLPHPSPTPAKRKQNYYWHSSQGNNTNTAIINHSTRIQQEQAHQQNSTVSYAPLFYHISPGSTGSRTLYHATCTAGFPSVHHKSFCISQTRGIKGVHPNVVDGVRSHYEILRLYQLAGDCTSFWNKGRIISIHLGDDHKGGNETFTVIPDSKNSKDTSQSPPSGAKLCSTSLDDWTNELRTHLKRIIQSGLVGLFDTPYPYLAPQILELANEYRKTSSPIIAMTERDPKSWAASRSKNHGILVCKKEYSYKGLGASEFDIIGCVDRAHNNDNLRRGNRQETATNGGTKHSEHSTTLHFWDVFQYRSHSDEIDQAFQLGMERQMQHHQELYLPMTQYKPDIFGIHSTANEKRSHPIKEKDVVVDISKAILGRKGHTDTHDVDTSTNEDNINNSRSYNKLQSLWQQSYTKSLTCRGRVDWIMKNDTLVEHYHLPKTCEMGLSKAGKEDALSDLQKMIPLIQQ